MKIEFDPTNGQDVMSVRKIVGIPDGTKLDMLLDLLQRNKIPGLGAKAYRAILFELDLMDRGILDDE